jgi:tetratricopeptide (TPR) repeat protein
VRFLLAFLLIGCTASPDVDLDGHTTSTDCDDGDPTRFPGALEFEDGIDNDCDGHIDEGPAPDLDAAEAAAQGSNPRLTQVATASLSTDPARAERLFSTLHAADSTDGVAFRGLAAANLALGRLDEASRLARRALTLAKAANDVLGEQEARTLLGEAQIRAGNADVARDQFEEGILRSDDGSTWGCAYQGLGELYARLDATTAELPSPEEIAAASDEEAFAAALAAWRRGGLQEGLAWAPRLMDQGAEGRVLAGVLHLQARDQEAVEPTLTGDDPGIALLKAHLAIAQRHFADAERWMGPPPTGDDEYSKFLAELHALARGWILANGNKHPDAVQVFHRLLEDQPKSILGLLGLGNSQLGAGHLDAAEATFGRVLALSPGNQYALAELSVIRLARGDAEGAEAGFHRVAEAAGDTYTCPYEGLGLAYLKQGRTDEAKAAFEKAISINPDIEYKKYNGLARIHLDAGRLDQAETLLKRSLANFPNDNPATAMLAELLQARSASAAPESNDGPPAGSD